MLCKKKFFKNLSMFLMVILLVTTVTPSFAGNNIGNIQTFELEGKTIKVEEINENSTLITEDESSSLISIKETENGFTTTIRDLETGEEHHLIRDEANKTIYSSITNKTISIEKYMRDDDLEEITPYAGTIRNERTITISTEDIADIVDIGAGVGLIATGILAIAKVSATTAGIIAILTGAGMITATILKRNYSNVKLTAYEVRKRKVQRGQVFYFWVDAYKDFSLIH